jgi:hypothetical protein
LIKITRVNTSFVLAASLVRRVQCARFSQHGWIGPARPARRCLFADVMKITGADMPTGKQADCSTGACAAVGGAKFALGYRSPKSQLGKRWLS